MRADLAPLLAVSICIMLSPMVSAGNNRHPQFNTSQIGSLDLPTVREPDVPPFCTEYRDICHLERTGQYEKAFSAYESRYTVCGWYGWTLLGSSSGYDAAVGFAVTPCGSRVAIKGSRRAKTIAHVTSECMYLKLMSSDSARADCPGCFPGYLYYSNMTGACYSVYVHDTASPARCIGKTPDALNHTKHYFRQGMRAIKTLRHHGIEHRDLSFRNVLIHRKFQQVNNITTHGHQVVIMDFGAAAPIGTQDGRRAGNRGHCDTYKWACDFLELLYRTDCRNRIPAPKKQFDPTSLESVLHSLLQKYHDPLANPDFDHIDALIQGVTDP